MHAHKADAPPHTHTYMPHLELVDQAEPRLRVGAAVNADVADVHGLDLVVAPGYQPAVALHAFRCNGKGFFCVSDDMQYWILCANAAGDGAR